MRSEKRSILGRRRGFISAAAAVFGALMSPAIAQDSTIDATVDLGGESSVSKSIILPVGKAAIVQLPRDASDVLVSSPIVDAVIRSPRRVYLMAKQDIGQANAFFFDSKGRQILNLEIQIEHDIDVLTDLLNRLMPNTNISVESINESVVLKGSVKSSAEATNAVEIAARFIGEASNVISMININQREQVMLKVRVVEMQRSIVKQLGIDVGGLAGLQSATIDAAASTIGAGVGASGLGLSATRFFNNQESNVNLSFQALEQIGVVKTLAEPTLTALSGEAANFLAGGEFPIPIAQRDDVVTIEFKQFGVGLGFTPLVVDKGRINLKISTEVSEITSQNNFTLSGSSFQFPGTPAVPGAPDQIETIDSNGDGLTDSAQNLTQFLIDNGIIDQRDPGIPAGDPTIFSVNGLTIPAFTVRRAKTTVELPSGGSLVLAGLLQENMLQTVNGIPGLKDVPVLGQLFRSRDYQNSETELVIMVTPYIVGPTHESKLTDPSKGFVAATDMQTIFLGKLVSTYGLSGSGVEEKTLQGPLGFILD